MCPFRSRSTGDAAEDAAHAAASVAKVTVQRRPVNGTNGKSGGFPISEIARTPISRKTHPVTMWNRNGLVYWSIAVLLHLSLDGCTGRGDDPVSVTTDIVDCKEGIKVYETRFVLEVVLPRNCEFRSTSSISVKWHSVQRELQVSATPSIIRKVNFDTRVFDVVVVRSGEWGHYELPMSFTFRDGAGFLALGDYLYILGGWTYEEPYRGGSVVSEVWRSSNGFDWEQLPNAPWPGRHGAAYLVHEGKIFVIGGDLYSDVYSTVDGINWTFLGDFKDSFGGRYTPNAVSLNGEIILYGGIKWLAGNCASPTVCTAIGFTDVWKSRSGNSWQFVGNTPWPGRGLIHGGIVHNGKIYLVGGGLKQSLQDVAYGETSVEFSDIWSSSDGKNWTLEVEKFNFPARTHFSVLSAFGTCWISDGSIGTQENVSNDLFMASDCIHFSPVITPDGYQKRHASSFTSFNGSLLVFGGPATDFPRRTLWRYTP